MHSGFLRDLALVANILDRIASELAKEAVEETLVLLVVSTLSRILARFLDLSAKAAEIVDFFELIFSFLTEPANHRIFGLVVLVAQEVKHTISVESMPAWVDVKLPFKHGDVTQVTVLTRADGDVLVPQVSLLCSEGLCTLRVFLDLVAELLDVGLVVL